MMGDSEKLSFERISLLEKIYDINNVGTFKMAPSGVAWRSADKARSEFINGSDLQSAVWRRSANGYELGISKADGNYLKWTGFQQEDLERIRPYAGTHFGLDIMTDEPAVKGFNWGEVEMTDNRVVFTIDGRTAFEIPVAEIQQTDKDARKTEVALMFPAPPGNSRHETLDSIRFFFQKDGVQDEVDEELDVGDGDVEKAVAETRAERLYNQLSQLTNKDTNASLAVATFPEIACRIPRGRYNLRLFEESITFHGPKFTYNIPYSQIQRLFLLEKADQSSVYFAIYVDPPIRQGQTSYPFFIMEIGSDDEVFDLPLNMPEEDLTKYDGLDKVQVGPVFRVLSRVLKKLSGANLSVADKDFTSARNEGSKCVAAALKTESGLLYPLKNSLLYLFKPALYVMYADIRRIEFDRQAGVTAKTFHMAVEMKNGITHTFSSIAAEEYKNLMAFMQSKNIKVEENEQADYSNVYSKDGRDGEKDHYLEQLKGGDSESSEDDDFNPDGDSDSDVADEYDSEVSDTDDESGSDEGSGSDGDGSPKKRKKAAKEKPAKKHKAEKKRGEKKTKQKKDANAPKKPLTSFMAYANEMRPKLKDESPDLSLAEVGKKLGEMWKELGEEGQQAYKDAYERDMEQWRTDIAEYKKNNPDVSDDDEDTPKKKAKPKSSSKPATKSTASKPGKKQEFQSAEFIEDSDEEAN